MTWLAPPLFLGAVLVAFRLVRAQPIGLSGKVLAVLFALPLGWVLISTCVCDLAKPGPEP